jgi:hypothetical protein
VQTTNFNDGSSYLAMNAGGGQYNKTRAFGDHAQLTVGDFNGDGHVDVATCVNVNAAGFSWLAGDGTGAFVAGKGGSPGGSTQHCSTGAVGDVDGNGVDGFLDFGQSCVIRGGKYDCARSVCTYVNDGADGMSSQCGGPAHFKTGAAPVHRALTFDVSAITLASVHHQVLALPLIQITNSLYLPSFLTSLFLFLFLFLFLLLLFLLLLLFCVNGFTGLSAPHWRVVSKARLLF